ncbi:GNAT family N-acetyltransferase [Mycoplasma sp. P36-A1]|uniref:GNAT family N-acetyltransferase n=1 Tax=Mycoplasma sp. P36-A1 TaxID=3252900 RepID=UPI003C2E4D65
MNEYTMRLAKREDASTIFNFITKLAIYEEMLEAVTGDVSLIEKNLFENKCAEVLLIEDNNKPVAFAVFFTGFSTFTCKGTLYLEDLFVDEEYRNKGIGTMVFKKLSAIAKERDYTRVEWVCLDWNQNSIDFYEEKIGANALKEWIRFRLDGENLENF